MPVLRQQLATLALFFVAGLAVASPVSRTASLLLVAAGVIAVFVAALVGRYGARTVAFGCLIAAGFLAPMNGLRLGASISFADVLLVPGGVLAVVARARPAHDAKPPEQRRMRPDMLTALLLVGGGVIGSVFATDLGASLSAIVRFGVAAFGVPLVFVALGPTRAEIRVMAWAFLAGACVNAIFGVVTYAPANRGIGLSTHSNHLGMACVLASGFAAGLFLTGSRRSGMVAAAGWAIVSVGILKSGSRAGVLGAAIVLLAVLVFTGSTRILKWCVLVTSGVWLLLALNVIPYDEQDALARLLGGNQPGVAQSNAERAQVREEGLEAIRQHPITGAGFGEARVAHNVYIQVWGAAGLVGLVGLAVMANASIRALFEGAAGDRFLLGAAACTFSFMLVAFASNILWDRYLWYTLAVFVTLRRQATVLIAGALDAPPPGRLVRPAVAAPAP